MATYISFMGCVLGFFYTFFLPFTHPKPKLFPDFHAKISMEMVCQNISIAKHPLAMEMESVYKTTT